MTGQDLYVFNYSVTIVFPPRFAIELACLIVAFFVQTLLFLHQLENVKSLVRPVAKLLNPTATGPDLAFTGTIVFPLCTCSCTSVCFRLKPLCFLTVMPK